MLKHANNTSGFQEAAATRAWQSILDFLATSLSKSPAK